MLSVGWKSPVVKLFRRCCMTGWLELFYKAGVLADWFQSQTYEREIAHIHTLTATHSNNLLQTPWY